MTDEETIAKFIEKLDKAIDACPSRVCMFFKIYALKAAIAKGEEEFLDVLKKAAELEARDKALEDTIASLKAEEN